MTTQEKYCHFCQHQGFCAIYKAISDIAGLLIANMRLNPISENGYQVTINQIAHDCKNFKHYEDK